MTMQYHYDRRAALSVQGFVRRMQIELARAYEKGGFDDLMVRAYEIEAGKPPFHDAVLEPRTDRPDVLRRTLLRDILGKVVQTEELTSDRGTIAVPLVGKDRFRIQAYRDDLRKEGVL